MRRFVARLALAMGSVVFVLAAAELALRAVGFEYRPMSINIGRPNDARMVHLFQDEHFVFDPELIWRPRHGTEIFNQQGFRGPLLEEGGGAVRIFTVGDSNTLGWAGADGANWPRLLGEKLRAAGREVELANAGVWGYSSFQGLARLREVLSYQPDLVLVSFGSNDAHLVSRSDRDFAGRALLARPGLRWLLGLRLGQLLAAAVDGGAAAEGEPAPRVPLDEYRANLREMAALCRAAGARMVLLTRPSIGPVRDPNWWKAFAPRYNLATVEMAAEEGLPVVDVYSFFKEEAEYFNDESHFTPAGHELAADIIAAHVDPLVAAVASGR